MPQFHLYKNSNKTTRKTYPYLLDIQSNLLSDIRTTIVVPLMPNRLAESYTISKLNPVVQIKNEKFTVMTQNLAGIDRNILGESVNDLSHYRSEIFAAIDFVLSGI
ncbi:MAG: CcdB family protein [Pseudomonadales bacterium]|nr:CcdB family protein [Pseudomonadales bacterium]MCB1669390.1 CcdB family protein [Pseudomonadales bacterium]MCP5344555.1 CcdB family protein [Pseudomonadales bacterium]